MALIKDLPDEVLLEIFRELYGSHFPLHLTTRYDELFKSARVCRTWYGLAFEVYRERCMRIGIPEQRAVRLWKSAMWEPKWVYRMKSSLEKFMAIAESHGSAI